MKPACWAHAITTPTIINSSFLGISGSNVHFFSFAIFNSLLIIVVSIFYMSASPNAPLGMQASPQLAKGAPIGPSDVKPW